MNYDKVQLMQINKVVDYIEEHIHDPLPLEQLAKVSTYSPFHFQRLFKWIIGETPAGYVKRLRMENAAHLLIYEPRLPITQIALISGYSSLSSFTYSFHAYFKTSPTSWREGAYLQQFPREYHNRKNSKIVSTNKKVENEHSTYNEFKWLDLSKVQVVQFPKCTTVNRYNIGSYMNGVPDVWEELYRWSNARGLVEQDTLMFGVPRSNPYITLPEKSRYDCRIAVPNRGEIRLDDEVTYSFSGGKYVLYAFDEPVAYSERNRLIECYSELYSYWLPISGYKYLGNPIELVNIEQVSGTLNLTCRISAIALAIEPK
ncbi:GyrI-like domain-containing protein [Paenibacillus sp. N3.4]|uniref:AraC family transcriptional regulator n=1 Tax=Paenibacillus sp. N3.4 TaxID=2603222 RepID=UPI0011CA7310|nr:helix-turn-helix domain-containing protein [Paenibacillus sp. N3.4]TXK80396.1 AraC family transcriptional regulator [Paenibacillus sp. N3.4]